MTRLLQRQRGGLGFALVLCLVMTAVLAPIAGAPARGDPPELGTVWAWGDNFNGELGDGTTVERHTAVQVSGLSGVTAIAGGDRAGYAIEGDGSVWAWGANSEGELGDGTTVERHTAVQVSGLSGVTAVAGGGSSGYALRGDGTVWAWGSNNRGQLGDGTTETRLAPVQVSGLGDVTAIAGGGLSGYALRSDGTVWAWGANAEGELGDGTTLERHTPVQVSGLSGVTAIDARGGSSAYALRGDGTVWAWGFNYYGQLGDGTTVDRWTPVQVSGLGGVISISGGIWSGYALKGDGAVWAWGSNDFGQLGDGTTIERHTAVAVVDLKGATAIAAGGFSGYAIRSDGSAWAWGFNHYGELGDGTTVDRHTPVRVFGLSGVSALSRGTFSGYALAGSGPAPGDQVFFTITGGLSYSNSQTLTSGDLAVGRDGYGIKTVSGTGTFPSSVSGAAQVGMNVSRFWIFPLYTGTVRVTDSAAGISLVHPVLFGKVDTVGGDGVTSTQGWADFSHFPWRPYTLTWTVRDLA